MFVASRSCSALILGLLLLTGCGPRSQGETDEQKERHYLAGRRRLATLDYTGAVEAFEAALQVNPRSASAHFELGLICEQKLSDYAGAIYHYERALRYRPDLPQAANIRPRIKACKVELADKETLVPVNAAVQKDLDRLNADNARLRQQVAQLLSQLTQASNAAALSRSAALLATNPLPTNVPSPSRPFNAGSLTSFPTNRPPEPRLGDRLPPRSSGHPPPAPLTRRKHLVKGGESVYSIARLYGLRPPQLLEANPGVDPARLRPGQVLIIPAP